jgi:hypothetical protein
MHRHVAAEPGYGRLALMRHVERFAILCEHSGTDVRRRDPVAGGIEMGFS